MSAGRPRAVWRSGASPPILRGVASATKRTMNENVSLIVMCLFLLGSLAFLAQQLTAYH